MVGVADQREVVRVFVDGERDAGPAGQDRLEQRVAVGVAGAAHRVRIAQERFLRQSPQRRCPGQALGQRRTQGFVEHVGHRLGHHGTGGRGGEEFLRKGVQTHVGGLAQRFQFAVVDDAERPHQPRPDLGLGQRALKGFEQAVAQLKRVVRELQIEERGFGLLELRGGGEHIVGQSGGLGHRDVDDHQQLQRFERLAARGRICQ